VSGNAQTSVPILPVLEERWSPRAFDPETVLTAADLTAAFEAARWAPSANNLQPWQFIAGFRGDATFQTIANNLMGFNQAWAPGASALVLAIAEKIKPNGDANNYALYDLGQAVAHFSVQAHSEGLSVHQMAGIEREALTQAFNLPAGFEPAVVIAVGRVGDADSLPEPLAEREKAPRERHDFDAIVHFEGYAAD